MKKSNSSALISVVGLIVLGIALVLGNWLLGRHATRIDVTADKLYSLSEGTHHILSELQSPVIIRFYYSRDNTTMPAQLKAFAKRVEDLLDEYQNNGGGKIRVEKFNPTPDSDAETTARLDGVEGQALPTGESLYLGLAINCVDATEAMPVLSPRNENNLEFDITRAIYRASHPEKITVGVLSTLPVMGSGGGGNPFMQQQRQPAWLFIDQLKRDYTVETVDPGAVGIPDSIKVLIIMHPKQLGEDTLYAIDQYVLRGGKVVAMVDPSALMDQSQQTQFGFTPPTPSTLGKLFDTWGVAFDTGKVIADRSLATPVERGADGRPVTLPAFLTLTNESANKDDIACNNLDRIMMPFAGAFTGAGAEGLQKTVLLSTTENSMPVDSFKAQQRDRDMAADFKPEGKKWDIAIRLTGNFKSAFPAGKPSAQAAEGDKKEEAGKPEHLTASAKPGAVVLIGDVDFLHEQFWAERTNLFGQQMVQVFGDNASFVQNLVEQLSGDSSLISIRSRGISNRAFTQIRDMQQKAEEKYQAELKKLEDQLKDAQEKISELQRTKKDASQKFILSPEQQVELEKFRATQVSTEKQLREVRKELRKDINWLENKIKIINIGLMPLLVILTGIGVAVLRRSRRAAHKAKVR